jgi:hypothetical protein
LEASDTAQKEALQTISKLDKHGSATWQVLHQGIKNWLKDREKMKKPSLNHYMVDAGSTYSPRNSFNKQIKKKSDGTMHSGVT